MLILLITSAWPCLQHSRNLGTTFFLPQRLKILLVLPLSLSFSPFLRDHVTHANVQESSKVFVTGVLNYPNLEMERTFVVLILPTYSRCLLRDKIICTVGFVNVVNVVNMSTGSGNSPVPNQPPRVPVPVLINSLANDEGRSVLLVSPSHANMATLLRQVSQYFIVLRRELLFL